MSTYDYEPSSFPLPRTSSSSSRPLSFAHQPQSTPPTLPRSLSSTMRLSVQLFQERHTTEFAHLHLTDSRTEEERRQMLAAEREKLDQARRIGRAKRQSLAFASSTDMDREDQIRAGWRPLSLLARREPPSKPASLFVAPNHRGSPSESRSSTQALKTRRSNVTEVVTPTDPSMPELSSPFPSDVHSPDLALITPSQHGISLGYSPTPELPTKKQYRHPSSSADHSIQSSTYSWASSFSGETVELRTAAHYVPRSECTSVEEEHTAQPEEVLDSPERTKRRRKRIVALAHTVRQLEGVGSRDVEDPNFYHTLVKAWNERPGNQPREPIWTQPVGPAQPPPAIPPRPIEEVFQPQPQSQVDAYLAPPAWLAPPALGSPGASFAKGSPVPSSTLEHRTPKLDESSSQEHSLDSHASSNPFRYSYASTLHDLALEGGVQHGNKLMSEKAWLKSPLFDQGTYGDAHTPSAPFPLGPLQSAPRVPSPQGDSPSKLSENSDSSACIPDQPAQPSRQLRKCREDISVSRMRSTKGKARLGAPIDLASNHSRADQSSAPSPAPESGMPNWGLGFLGNWLRDELADANGPEPSSPESESVFHIGENGKRSEGQTYPSTSVTTTTTALKRKREDSDDRSFKRCYNVVEIENPPHTSLTIEEGGKGDGSMETIDLVLPAPLPTPEIELIAQQTGKTREEISPSVDKLPVECTVAKEYQYSTPCPRLSYSIPSDMSYPHHLEYTVPAASTSMSMSTSMPLQANPEEDGAGVGRMGRVTEEMEESYLSSENFSSPSQTSQVHRPLRLPHLEQASSTFPVFAATASETETEADMQLERHNLKTPNMTLQPILPPLPPTPKYRRPTPPFPLQPFIDKLSHSRITELQSQSYPHPQTTRRSGLTEEFHQHNSTSLELRQAPEQEQASSRMIRPQNQNYDHSSFQGFAESEPVTLRDERYMVSQPDLTHNARGLAAPLVMATASEPIRPVDLEKALPTSYVPSHPKSRTPMMLFILGFLCPLLWFIGGWPILRPSPSPAPGTTRADDDIEARAQRQARLDPQPRSADRGPSAALDVDVEKQTRVAKHSRITWINHPDPMVRACRWAAITTTPCLIMAAIVAGVVVAVH